MPAFPARLGAAPQRPVRTRALARPLEPNRVLRAGHDAESARLTGIAVRGVGDLLPVHPELEARQRPERAEVGVIDATHLEDPIRAYLGAIRLALAARVIHDRP